MVLRNPKLLKCTALSVAASIIEAAIKGLEISDVDGQAFLVPFKDNKNNITACQLIIGYRGYTSLAWRSNITMEGFRVYEKDKFEVKLGTDPQIIHSPYSSKAGISPGPLMAVYAVASFHDGRKVFSIHNRSEIERRRKLSRASDGRAWTEFYEAMAEKGPKRDLGSKVIPHAYAPMLVESAITDERREYGIEAPPPDQALEAACEVTNDEPPREAKPKPTGEFQSRDGLLTAVTPRGKVIIATLDTGDQQTMDFSTFDRNLLQGLRERVNSRITMHFTETTKGDKIYKNIVSFEGK
jgi:phage RecT family recombinase